MAIGSPDQAARLDQLRVLARAQVWSGYLTEAAIRADLYDAVLDELRDPEPARELADRYVDEAYRELRTAAATWPIPSGFDRLRAAFDALEARGVIVLQACEDHWSADARLREEAAMGTRPRGIAYFTHSDVWHAVEHGMLEVNLWHGTRANVAPGDELLADVQRVLAEHGIASLFDEGRIEVSVAWERRPDSVTAGKPGDGVVQSR